MNNQLEKFDELQRKCITDVINIDLNDDQWTQSTLPIRDGGLGIRSAAMLAPSAILASAASTLGIQNDILPARFHAIPDSAVGMATNAWRSPSNSDIQRLDLHIKQKEWDKVITKKFKSNCWKKLTIPSTKLYFELPRHYTQATGSSHHQSPQLVRG